MIFSKIYIIEIFIIFVLLGCSTDRLYTGDPLPPEEASIINGSGTLRGIYFVEKNHNGKIITSTRVEVKPGFQELKAHFYDTSKGPFYENDLIIKFKAEPGHEYIIKCDKKGKTWIEDKDSGNVVNGETK